MFFSYQNLLIAVKSGVRDTGASQIYRSYLKIRIFGRNQGATENQPAGIHKYVEDLRRGRNAEFGRKDFFEMGSNTTVLCFKKQFVIFCKFNI